MSYNNFQNPAANQTLDNVRYQIKLEPHQIGPFKYSWTRIHNLSITSCNISPNMQHHHTNFYTHRSPSCIHQPINHVHETINETINKE